MNITVNQKKIKFTYFIFKITPVGTPTVTEAKIVLYFEIFFSAPYSARNPNVPTLKIKKIK